VAFAVNPPPRKFGASRITRVRVATAVSGLLVVVILTFVAWKILDLASASDRSRQAEIAFAALETEMAVQHGLEWETFATNSVTPEVADGLRASHGAIEAALVQIEDAGVPASALAQLVADVRHVSAAIDQQFNLMAAGNKPAARRLDEQKTDPAFAEITKHLQVLTAHEATQSRQARSGLRVGTLLGLGGAAAGIIVLLFLLAFITRRAALMQAETLDELRQSQKMDAVGQLAGGVAHDFNNLLTAISGYSELALSRLDERPDPELRADIEQIAKSGERAAGLTRQLLALSRRQTLQPTVFDLNEAVAGTESLLRRLLGTHIVIATTLDSSECTIQADHGQIEQVIMNLALNSRDAMPEGGVLRIETEAVRLTDGDARERFQAPAGEYVVLRVSDDGSGMEEATRQRAFEPFYTTKAPGEGTGLGLATVYGIVAQSGGFIALESKPGAGTTFELLLPQVALRVAAGEPIRAPATDGGSERILLVEDEEVVRNLTHALLSRKGYDVTVASAGGQALELSRDHCFDLVITDMVMPQMSGRALAERLVSERPSLPIIFISGYAHDVSGGDIDAIGVFLQKPFTAHDLSVAVRTSLDR
jgi:signal transduction histidine kinase